MQQQLRSYKLTAGILAVILVAAGLNGSRLSPHTSRGADVKLQVLLNVWDGASMEGLRLFVIGPDGNSQNLIIGPLNDGEVRIAARKLEGQTVRLQFRSDETTFKARDRLRLSAEALALNSDRRSAWLSRYYSPQLGPDRPWIDVDLNPEQDTYVLSISLDQASTVIGRLVNAETGHPIPNKNVRSRNQGPRVVGSSDRDGRFVAGPLQSHRRDELFLTSVPLVHTRAIPAQGLAPGHRVNIGECPIRPTYEPEPRPEIPRYAINEGRSLAELEISITRLSEAARTNRWEGIPGVEGLTLIATDGSQIATFLGPAIRIGRQHKGPDSWGGDWPRIPFGSWYVVPHYFEARTIQLAVLDAARQGVDLRSRGIPVLEVVPQDNVTPSDAERHNYDALEITRAIHTFLSDEGISYVDGWPQRKSDERESPSSADAD